MEPIPSNGQGLICYWYTVHGAGPALKQHLVNVAEVSSAHEVISKHDTLGRGRADVLDCEPTLAHVY